MSIPEDIVPAAAVLAPSASVSVFGRRVIYRSLFHLGQLGTADKIFLSHLCLPFTNRQLRGLHFGPALRHHLVDLRFGRHWLEAAPLLAILGKTRALNPSDTDAALIAPYKNRVTRREIVTWISAARVDFRE